MYFSAGLHEYKPEWVPDLPSKEIGENSRHIILRNVKIGDDLRDVGIRVVESKSRIEAASDLLNDRYAWRGYGRGHKIITDPYHITFTAELDGKVVGTITLGVDSDNGLASDRSFGDHNDDLRERGAKICELKRFAFCPSVQSKELKAALFHIVFVYGSRTFGCTDLMIEVNERHVRFYEAMLCFSRVGESRHNSVIDRPVQLLRLEVAKIRDYIDQASMAAGADHKRSLYSFFLSPSDEAAIYRRLTGDHVDAAYPSRSDHATDGWPHLPAWQYRPRKDTRWPA